MKRYMGIHTHKDNNEIPKGKAVLFLDDGGFVGTNNGYLSGQPALFPEDQAMAISTVWNYIQEYHQDLDEMPHPEFILPKIKHWLNA